MNKGQTCADKRAHRSNFFFVKNKNLQYSTWASTTKAGYFNLIFLLLHWTLIFQISRIYSIKRRVFRPRFYLLMTDVLDEIFFKNLYAHIWIWFKVHLVSDIPRKNTVKFDKQVHVNHSKLNTLKRTYY